MNASPTAPEIESILLKEITGMFEESFAASASTPLQSLGLDSLRLFELFVLVEKQFGLSLLETPLSREALENIGSLARHIAAQLAEKA